MQVLAGWDGPSYNRLQLHCKVMPMDMSAEEIKQFWRGFCQRRKIAADVVAKGDAIIDKDPEYWADQTMGDLLDSITTGKKPS